MPKLHHDLHVRIIQAGMKRFYQIRLLLQFATCRSRPVAGSAGQFVSDVLIDHWVHRLWALVILVARRRTTLIRINTAIENPR